MTARPSDSPHGYVYFVRETDDLIDVIFARRDQVSPLVLAEEPRRIRQRFVAFNCDSGISGKSHLRGRNGKPAVGEIVRRRDETLCMRRANEFPGRAFRVEVDRRCPALTLFE